MHRRIFESKFTLFLGLISAGFGQFIFMWSSKGALSGRDFSALVVLAALIGIPIFMVSSPLHFLILIDDSSISSGLKKQKIGEIGASISLTAIYFVAASVFILVDQIFYSYELKISAVLFIGVSGYVQIHSGIQRGVLAAQQKWGLIGAQLGIEGIIRIVFSIFILCGIASNSRTIQAMYSLPVIFVVWLVSRFVSGAEIYKLLQIRPTLKFEKFVPFWLSSIGLHVMVTMAPLIMNLKGESVSEIAVVGLALFVIRVPITLAGSFLTPIVQKFVIIKDSKEESLRLIIKIFVATITVFSVMIFLVQSLPVKYVSLIFQEDVKPLEGVIEISVAASGILLLVVELQAFLIANRNFTLISKGWIFGVSAYVGSQFIPLGANGALWSILFGSASVYLYFLYYTIKFYVTNSLAIN